MNPTPTQLNSWKAQIWCQNCSNSSIYWDNRLLLIYHRQKFLFKKKWPPSSDPLFGQNDLENWPKVDHYFRKKWPFFSKKSDQKWPTFGSKSPWKLSKAEQPKAAKHRFFFQKKWPKIGSLFSQNALENWLKVEPFEKWGFYVKCYKFSVFLIKNF